MKNVFIKLRNWLFKPIQANAFLCDSERGTGSTVIITQPVTDDLVIELWHPTKSAQELAQTWAFENNAVLHFTNPNQNPQR